MYCFVKVLPHLNPVVSLVAYLYEDMDTHKYYLSYYYPYPNPYQKNVKEKFLVQDIGKVVEVSNTDIDMGQINNYDLNSGVVLRKNSLFSFFGF